MDVDELGYEGGDRYNDGGHDKNFFKCKNGIYQEHEYKKTRLWLGGAVNT